MLTDSDGTIVDALNLVDSRLALLADCPGCSGTETGCEPGGVMEYVDAIDCDGPNGMIEWKFYGGVGHIGCFDCN